MISHNCYMENSSWVETKARMVMLTPCGDSPNYAAYGTGPCKFSRCSVGPPAKSASAALH